MLKLTRLWKGKRNEGTYSSLSFALGTEHWKQRSRNLCSVYPSTLRPHPSFPPTSYEIQFSLSFLSEECDCIFRRNEVHAYSSKRVSITYTLIHTSTHTRACTRHVLCRVRGTLTRHSQVCLAWFRCFFASFTARCDSAKLNC